MSSFRKPGIIFWFGLALALYYTHVTFKHHLWTERGVIQQDVRIYYEILPATFEYGDPTFGFVDSLHSRGNREYWVGKHPETGKGYMKYSIGLAYAYLPGYLIARTWCKITGYPEVDHFDPPYHAAVIFSTLFFSLLGFFFAAKALQKLFDTTTAVLTAGMLYFATGIWHYTLLSPGYGHVFSFALVAAMVYCSIRFKETNRNRYIFLVALLLGWITLIRPTNMLVAIFPLLYIPGNVKESLSFWLSRWKVLLTGSLFFLLPAVPQLVLWKVTTGSWLHYSYNEEGFFFTRSQLLKGLFSFRNGFFNYTPIFLLFFPGFYFLWKRSTALAIISGVFFLVSSYVMYSWWCWWYGGSFGSRPQIDGLIITVLPIAALIAAIVRRRFLLPVAVIVIAVFARVNIYQSNQAKQAILHWDANTWRSYKGVFLTMRLPWNIADLLKYPDYDGALAGKEYPVELNKIVIPNDSVLDASKEFPFGHVLDADSLQAIGVHNVYLTLAYYPDDQFAKSTWFVGAVENDKGETVFYQNIELLNENLERNTWHMRKLEVNLPDDLPQGSIIKGYLYNPNYQPLKVRDFKFTNF